MDTNSHMAIPADIQTEAARYDDTFELTATGGGCDYVTRYLGKDGSGREWVAVMAASGDAGSPESLTDCACITIYSDGYEWRSGVSVAAGTARQCLALMADMDIINAG